MHEHRIDRQASEDPSPATHRCGTIAIVGRPNVGKSSLLNQLIGQKLAITSHRPQTTRHRILGIRSDDDAQMIFLDAPGWQRKQRSPMNRMLNRTAEQVIDEADLLLWVIDASQGLTDEDLQVLSRLEQHPNIIAVLNKIDRVKLRASLYQLAQDLALRAAFKAIVPVSAERATQVDVLIKACKDLLPVDAPRFAPDELTDRSERFLAAEIIREKLFRLLGDELPYQSTVLIEQFRDDGALKRIEASIVVQREAQRAIVLGQAGQGIKRIGTDARRDMERLFGTKIFLGLHVKVRDDWASNEQGLAAYGYGQ
ncbi:MAG: GTPase Era [Betaproteobacteria bacterium]|nr:GTPase Era [Pseudomonadota bacterium]NBO11565.1 GTPase Era [Betaproteobacteria bacterium]NBO43358.1 GTPase Era [Betaproteobacteria bacterium]NBP61131.1 GTPase Era [Betaproteobacteria bacterium]NBQ80877.1 GTPase Era [Betaproteobacteria bacterium]